MLPVLALLATLPLGRQESPEDIESRERTCFQTGSFYNPRIHIPAEVAIVYGIDKTMPARVKSWRDAGYRVSLMTGVAWGEYQDYLYGRFDGINHENEAQQEKSGYKISHGGDVYYMSPGPSYGKFLSQGVGRAIQAGVDAVYLEEPEFWVRGGYGDGFKQEWKKMYGTDWQDPQSSVDARWKANKLMYFLYRRALQQVFDYVQDYNKKNHKHIRCYVATHSLLNYASWGIVSPESSLAKLRGCDGYIAQVWTGTARTPNDYDGIHKERTFETAYLEYGAALNMVAGTNKRMTFLADPIEDNPDHDWGDYRRNWESCIVASLLHTEVDHFEVMPWPERIFNGKYPSEQDHSKRVPIPDTYATEIQVVCHALGDLGYIHSGNPWKVLISDSLMFQRGGPNESDADLNHIYGLALPLVEAGIPVVPVQLENLDEALAEGPIDSTMLMTYEGMKPLTPKVHLQIANWVRRGGHLIVVDNDADPFNDVQEWWSKKYKNPRRHLFKTLGLPLDFVGRKQVGQGVVLRVNASPSELARTPGGAMSVLAQIHRSNVSISGKVADDIPPAWKDTLTPNGFQTRFWNYETVVKLRPGARGLTVTPSDRFKGMVTNYRVVDLFDPNLAIVQHPDPSPDGRHLYAWVRLGEALPAIVALAGTESIKKLTSHRLEFKTTGIENTNGIALLQIPHRPNGLKVDGESTDFGWNSKTHLVWVRYPNHATGRSIAVNW